jgi:hypothetical protein
MPLDMNKWVVPYLQKLLEEAEDEPLSLIYGEHRY